MVQCLEHAYIIVDKGKLTFPTSNLTMENFKSNARLWAWTEARLRTRALYNRRPERMRASVWWETCALVLVTEKRNSGQISLDSPVNRLSRRSAEACKLKKTKRKANWTDWERILYLDSPVESPICSRSICRRVSKKETVLHALLGSPRQNICSSKG